MTKTYQCNPTSCVWEGSVYPDCIPILEGREVVSDIPSTQEKSMTKQLREGRRHIVNY